MAASLKPRAFDLAAFKREWREMCAFVGADPDSGPASVYDVVHIRAEWSRRARIARDAADPRPRQAVTLTDAELHGLIAHVPVLPDGRPLRAQVFADAWRAVIADRMEAERRTRQAFAAALIDALLKADERDAMLRALLRTMPLKERHKRRGITLKWIPDGAGGLLRVETALPLAGD